MIFYYYHNIFVTTEVKVTYRNFVVFENSVTNLTLEKVCLSQAKKFHFCVSKAKQVTLRIAIPIKWSKPLPGWHKLNTDGVSLGNPSKVGGGGLI